MQVDTCRNFHDMNAVRSKILKSDHPDDDIHGHSFADRYERCVLGNETKKEKIIGSSLRSIQN